MPWAEILTSGVVASFISGAFAFFGKRHLDKRLEEERTDHQKEIEELKAEKQRLIESFRARLKNSEIFFNRQIKACDEIHELYQSMIPESKFSNMEWEDALVEMAYDIKSIEKEAKKLYTKHYAVLPDSILTKLNAAVGYAAKAKFEAEDEVTSIGLKLVDSTFNELSKATVKAKELLDGQRHNLIEPHFKKDSK